MDLTIHPGKITALVGPNGSGKTTLIKTILGLSKPDGGSIVVGGHTLNGDWRYRNQVGYMPQIPPLPENLAAGELFEMLRTSGRSEVGPDPELVEAFGLDDQLESPLRTLSGGTRQKVNAVMAFMFQPGPPDSGRAHRRPGPPGLKVPEGAHPPGAVKRARPSSSPPMS